MATVFKAAKASRHHLILNVSIYSTYTSLIRLSTLILIKPLRNQSSLYKLIIIKVKT
jgi:hypothetical protein